MTTFTLKSLIARKPVEPILEHDIQKRAFEIYRERGGRDGRALDDWLEAEQQLLQRIAVRDNSKTGA